MYVYICAYMTRAYVYMHMCGCDDECLVMCGTALLDFFSFLAAQHCRRRDTRSCRQFTIITIIILFFRFFSFSLRNIIHKHYATIFLLTFNITNSKYKKKFNWTSFISIVGKVNFFEKVVTCNYDLFEILISHLYLYNKKNIIEVTVILIL